jgi:hypothetical protein
MLNRLPSTPSLHVHSSWLLDGKPWVQAHGAVVMGRSGQHLGNTAEASQVGPSFMHCIAMANEQLVPECINNESL